MTDLAARLPVGRRPPESSTRASSQAPGIHFDDVALTARFRAGDEAALAHVFTAHHASLCGFAASYVRDADSAEELVQEVFLALWERRQTLDLRNGLRAYLFGAVRNRALNVQRHARYERTLALQRGGGDGIPGMGQPPEDTDASTRAAEIDAAVTAAVVSMPERMRAALTLSWREGLTHGEIARVLAIAPKTVENHIGRALKHLRRKLGHFLA